MAAVAAAGIASRRTQTPPQSFPFEGGTLTITESDEWRQGARPSTARNSPAISFSTTTRLSRSAASRSRCSTRRRRQPVRDQHRHRLEARRMARSRAPLPATIAARRPAAITEQSIYFVPYPAARRVEAGADMDPDRRAEGRGHARLHAAARHRLEGSRSGQALQHRRRLRQRGGLCARQANARRRHHRLRNGPAGRRRHGEDAVGVFYASGCVPHACGGADAFMGSTRTRHKLYFASRATRSRVSPPGRP